MNISTESPIVTKNVSPNALNKVAWSDDGKRIVTGDSKGKISLFNVDKEIVESSAEDSLKLERIIAQAQSSKQSLLM